MNELLNSNINMIGKDFRTIWNEMLDIAKKYSNKWDPSLSNDSDPGVVILKECALYADKNNYNCDKNVLECFPLSVTQLGNAWKLYDQLGYNMKWYISGKTDSISIILNDDSILAKQNNIITQKCIIPAFTTLIDESGEIKYTTLNSIELDKANYSYTVDCIEGIVQDYLVNNQRLITLNNLDADLRLYFDESQIAENGIFIANVIGAIEPNFYTSPWTRVDNLESYPLSDLDNGKVYEFGVLPNTNTCYIQFPQNIANLIENGLYIKYTISSGQQGNIKSNTITSLYTDITTIPLDTNITSESSVINDKISILQSEPVTNGADPEDLDSAYYNYKKTIGTFNTLVTKKDYENAIYKLTESNQPIISNCIVSDRTNDINYSNYIQRWAPNLTYKELVVSSKDNNPILLPYDLMLYLLQYQNNIYNKETYNNTFNPNISLITQLQIEAKINELKSTQHDIKLPEVNDNTMFMFKNMYLIKGNLITYYKVSAEEATKIEENVQLALFNKYNSRNLTFGEEISYDDLINTVLKADNRIKSFIVNNTGYSISQVNTSGLTITQNTQPSIDDNLLVARMILAGNVQLFNIDTEFNYDFGQVDSQVVKVDNEDIINSITTEVNLNIPVYSSATEGYELKENEIIQIYSPNLISVTNYSNNVGYQCNLNNPIPADTDYELKGNETIVLTYLDSNNIQQTDILSAGKIVNSNISLKTTTNVNWLSTGQYIKEKRLNQSTIPLGTQYAFILNNPENRLNIPPKGTYILQQGEMFIYKGSNSLELVINQSGTMLYSENGFDVTYSLATDLSNITENKDKDIWKTLDNTTGTLVMTELEIITLAKGTKVWCQSELTNLNNEEQVLGDNNFYYTDLSGVIQTIKPFVLGSSLEWRKIRSRLNINSIKDNPQFLNANQSMTFKFKNTVASKIVTNPYYVQFNDSVIVSGGENIDTSSINNSITEYNLKAFIYKKSDSNNINRNNGYVTIALNNIKPLIFSFTPTSEKAFDYWLIPMSLTLVTPGLEVTLKVGNKEFNIYGSTDKTHSLTESTNKILQVPYSTTTLENITITVTGATATINDTISFGNITKLNGLNSDEINYSDLTYSYDINKNIEDIITKIKLIDVNNNFNWLYKVPNEDKVISPTNSNAYWDINHIYNRYTIPQIDFTKSSITVYSSSKA